MAPALTAEAEAARLSVVVGEPQILREDPGRGDLLAVKARLRAERAAGPPLAGQAVTDRDPHRLTLGDGRQLTTAATGFTAFHVDDLPSQLWSSGSS